MTGAPDELAQRDLRRRCYFVDMRPVFDKDGDGLPDSGMINIDGIHPTYQSSPLMAQAVWEVMQQHCLASE